MSARGRRGSAARLVVLIVLILICIWLLYKVFIGIPPAPPPTVKTGGLDAAPLRVV
jgi:hypothetical protein